jgi:hypothetical protein
MAVAGCIVASLIAAATVALVSGRACNSESLRRNDSDVLHGSRAGMAATAQPARKDAPEERPGTALHGPAQHGGTAQRHGAAARQGKARQGKARQGKARHGTAPHGAAR